MKSKKFIPNILNSDIRLKERALKTPNIQANVPKTIEAVILFNFNSTNQATLGSKSEIEELSAAMVKRIKKRTPKNDPNGIPLKAIGKVTKTKPGPSAGDKPLEKTIGKIAIPAKSATKVSKKATVSEVDKIDWLLGI